MRTLAKYEEVGSALAALCAQYRVRSITAVQKCWPSRSMCVAAGNVRTADSSCVASGTCPLPLVAEGCFRPGHRIAQGVAILNIPTTYWIVRCLAAHAQVEEVQEVTSASTILYNNMRQAEKDAKKGKAPKAAAPKAAPGLPTHCGFAVSFRRCGVLVTSFAREPSMLCSQEGHWEHGG